MADDKKEAAKPEAKKESAKVDSKKAGVKGSHKMLMTVGGLVFGASIWYIFPSMLLLIGMVPTIVAFFTVAEEENGSSVIAIATMNAAGILPFVIDLWQRGQTVGHALEILTTPFNWVVMLGGAGIGQLILYAVPQAIAYATIARTEARIKLLNDNLETLKAVWGADVATTKPINQIAKGQ